MMLNRPSTVASTNDAIRAEQS